MARPLRIEFENAWYHVMNRSLGRQNIFLNDRDRRVFFDLLQECRQVFGWEIHAYCLMSNHYHLFLKTPRGNLSRAMRHLNGVYTQRFNLAHGKEGPLFRGRYKAVLVDAEAYLLQVSRYIHLNPVKAGLVKNPEDYPWSSYRAYLSQEFKPAFLELGDILDTFGSQSPSLRIQEFTAAGIDDETQAFYSRKSPAPVLGNAKSAPPVASHEEIPQSRRVQSVPTISRIIEIVSQAYETPQGAIVAARQRRVNEPRSVAIYLARMLGGYSLKTIAESFGSCRYSTIGNTVHAVRTRLLGEADFAQRMAALERAVAGERLADKSKMEI